MSNSFFKFKNFTIHQDRCAMKVCTDSCLLGAWFAAKLFSPRTMLDIGGGTGLLMLMLAQKNSSVIHGIELDGAAQQQSEENIAASPWGERLHMFAGDARSWLFPVKYDFIISNPPFYSGELTSDSTEKNRAMHSTDLSFDDLLSVIEKNLAPDGHFGILLPFQRSGAFEKMAARHHFFIKEKVSIRQTPTHPYFRNILHFTKENQTTTELLEICIKDADGKYTEVFAGLMQDYYL